MTFADLLQFIDTPIAILAMAFWANERFHKHEVRLTKLEIAKNAKR